MSVRGTVVELWRYPVKSMLGERCKRIDVDRRGVFGDRRFAIQDANGKLGSGKNTARFRKIEGLLTFHATYLDQTVQVCFPDGRLIRGDDRRMDAVLSETLGQPVRLVRETEVSHFDEGALHLLSQGSLGGLQGVAPEGAPDSRRFRPNMVISTQGDQPEQEWLSKRIRIGGVTLEIIKSTARCAMVALPQDGVTEAPEVLRHIARESELVFGVYAKVVVPGVVREGDDITELWNES